jgi:hypothetical protein
MVGASRPPRVAPSAGLATTERHDEPLQRRVAPDFDVIGSVDPVGLERKRAGDARARGLKASEIAKSRVIRDDEAVVLLERNEIGEPLVRATPSTRRQRL